MKRYDILKKIPGEGFLKVGSKKNTDLTIEQKAALNRKGNELFNKKEFEKAKRIFLTTGYTDGIIRIGDYHYQNNEVLEAFRMYILAPAQDKKEMLIGKMAVVIQLWLKEEKELKI